MIEPTVIRIGFEAMRRWQRANEGVLTVGGIPLNDGFRMTKGQFLLLHMDPSGYPDKLTLHDDGSNQGEIRRWRSRTAWVEEKA